jgi:hypothetical protein
MNHTVYQHNTHRSIEGFSLILNIPRPGHRERLSSALVTFRNWNFTLMIVVRMKSVVKLHIMSIKDVNSTFYKFRPFNHVSDLSSSR